MIQPEPKVVVSQPELPIPADSLDPVAGWNAGPDLQAVLPSAKRGAVGLWWAFAILRGALLVVALLGLGRIMFQTEQKHWFENRLYALNYLDRSYVDVKAAKADIYNYTLGSSEESLKEAAEKLTSVHARLKKVREYVDEKPYLDDVATAENLIVKTIEQPLQTALKDRVSKGDAQVRVSLLNTMLENRDGLSPYLFRVHFRLGTTLYMSALTYRKQLQENFGSIFIVLGTFVLLLGGLTRGYIKQRQRNETILRASEAQVRLLLDNMYDGLVVVDEQGNIETTNPKLEDLLGGTSQQLVSKPLASILGDQVEALLSSVRESSFTVLKECIATKCDGSTFPSELSARAVPTPSGERVLVTLRDITQKKQTEQWKRDMVAVVSHDLRTPLTAMQGSLELVQIGALGKVPLEIAPLVLTAKTNTVKLISTINTLLDLEKLESSGDLPDLRPTDLSALALSALTPLIAQGQKSGHSVNVEPMPFFVMADTLRLSQLMEHLVDNAIRFSPSPSTITVSAQVKDFGWIELKVSDKGRGIPKEALDRVFQRLYQVQESDRQKGAGLGLALCKAIANLHGGAIGVESEPDCGSSFWVLLKSGQAVTTDAPSVLLESPVAAPGAV